MAQKAYSKALSSYTKYDLSRIECVRKKLIEVYRQLIEEEQQELNAETI